MPIITPAEFRLYKGIESLEDDPLILTLINAAELWLDRECGRTLVATADTTRYYDAYNDVNGRFLILDHVCAGVTAVTIDGTVLPSTEYTLHPRNEPPYDEIIIKRGSTYAWVDDNAVGDYDPEDAIAVTGKFGYYDGETAVPENIKAMVKRLVSFMYSQKDTTVLDAIQIVDGTTTIPQGFPAGLVQQVKFYRRLT